jgi:hypothetical protein
LGVRGRRISEFKANLVYSLSSRIARATQRNPVSKKKKRKERKKEKKRKKRKEKKRKEKKRKEKKRKEKKRKEEISIWPSSYAGYRHPILTSSCLP